MATIRYDIKEKATNMRKGYRIHSAIVQYKKDGKPKRKTFKDKAQAKSFYDGLILKEKTVGQQFWDLKPADAQLAFSAFDRAREGGYNLLEALTFYEHRTNNICDIPLQEVGEDMIELNNQKDCSISYKRTFETVVNWFCGYYSDRNINTFTTEDIDNAINDPVNKWSISTKENKKRNLSIFFNLAIKHKMCKENPVKYLNSKERKKVISNFIDYMTASEAEALMEVVINKLPQYVPVFAMCLYNGLRIDTAARMIPSDIHIEKRLLHVPACIDKTNNDRTIDMTPKCHYYLEKYMNKQSALPCMMPHVYLEEEGQRVLKYDEAFKLSDKERRRVKTYTPEQLHRLNYKLYEDWKHANHDRFNNFRRIAKYTLTKAGGRWPANGHRHAFITHYMMIEQDATKVSHIAGNSPRMCYSNYIGKCLDKEDALKYFAVPEKEGVIVSMNTAA